MIPNSNFRAPAVGALLWLSLLLAGVAYGQGITGMFFVDDYENLQGLSSIGESPMPESAIRFAAAGFSGPLGRPLSLLSFVPQWHSWPDAPSDFIEANIALHLLNACLVFWTLLRGLQLVLPEDYRRAELLALAATWLWMLAPPQAGAVLYVIQRMAELSGTFMLLGLLLYVTGRRAELKGQRARGMLWMSAGLGTGTALGLLAKENAALFPMMLLALEGTLFQGLARSALWRRFAALMLWLPSLAVLGYLACQVPHLLDNPAGRDFSFGERLLTEPRVLWMYLQKFFLPPLYGMRLYYDDFPVSHSLLEPWTTLPAIAGWLAMVTAAAMLRQRAPTFAFAVLWFLATHVLESSIIPLELAFDHRNYIGLMGPALALAWYGARVLEAPLTQRVRPVLVAAAAAYAGFFLFAMAHTASFWGQPWELAHYWSEQQPDSRRAQRGAAKFFWKMDDPERAVEVYENALQRWPGDISLLLGIYELGCAYPNLQMPAQARITSIVAQFDSTIPSTVGMLNVLVTGTEENLCRRYTPAELWSMVEMVFDTPRLASQEQNHLLLQSRIADLANDRPLARTLLDRALRERPAAQALHQGILWSLQSRDAACAQRYLERLDASTAVGRVERWAYRDELAQLRAQLARLPAGAHPVTPSECIA